MEFMISSAHEILSGAIKSRRMRWAGHMARRVERRGARRKFQGKSERKKLERPKCGRKDNIKRDIQKNRTGAWTELNWLRIGTSDILF
jgi:hypothetical protein